MTPELPLPAQLSQALVAFAIEFDNEFEHRMPHRTTSHGAMRALREAAAPLAGSGADRPPLWRGLESYPDGWRAAVQRPLTLPHFPVISARGGFPDGN
jgi:hypothetical protein